MAEQLQLRRGTATEMAAFTPVQGEVVIDTTNNRAIVGDGSTVGGWPAAKLSEVLTNTRTAVADVNYTVLPTDRLVAYTTLSATRIVTLPLAATFPLGTPLRIINETTIGSGSVYVEIITSDSDGILGLDGINIKAPFSSVTLESNGVDAWTITALYDYTRTSYVADVAYAIHGIDRVVAVSTLTASRILTLPATTFFPAGIPLLIIDQSGNCSPTKTISIGVTGTDTFSNGGTGIVLEEAFQYVVLINNGAGVWFRSAESPLKGNRGKTIQLGVAGTISAYGGSVEFTGTASFTATITTPAAGITYTPTLDLWNNSTATITLSSTVNFVGPLGTSTTTKTLAAGATLYLEYDGSVWVAKR